MLKILDQHVYCLDKEKIDREQILDWAMHTPRPQDLSFMIYQNNRFYGVKSVADFLENREVLPFFIKKKTDGYQLFHKEDRVWELCAENTDIFFLGRVIARDFGMKEGQRIAVLDEMEQCEFLLSYQENRLYGKNIEGCVYDTFLSIDEVNHLDFTLLNQYDSIVFYEYNEYTDYIKNVCLLHTSLKDVIFLDELARKYGGYENIQSETQLSKNIRNLGRVLYVSTNDVNEYGSVKRYLTGVYSVLAVMKSLCWCGKVSHFGELYPEDTILFLDFDVKGSGLVDLMKFTAAYCELAEERNMIPVADYRDTIGHFTTDITENVWETFFEPLSHISVEEASKAANVVVASQNGMQLVDWEINPYIYQLDCMIWEQAFLKDTKSLLRINCRVKEDLKKKAKESLPKQFQEGKKILGVIARGSDYRKEARSARGEGDYISSKSIEELLLECEQKRNEEGYDYLYIATEDMEYFEQFYEAFGDILLFHNQNRVRMGADTFDKLVSDFLNVKDQTLSVSEYCNILSALGSCDEIISSMNCGAYLAGLTGMLL